MRIIKSTNLATENESVVLRSAAASALGALSLSVVSAPASRRAAWRSLLEYSVTLLDELGFRLTLWLFACSCERDSAIARHRRLWKALEMGGYRIPAEKRTSEISRIRANASLCFYAAVPVAAHEAEQVPFGPASRSFLALLPRDSRPDVEGFVNAGWTRGIIDMEELTALATTICAIGGLLVRPFGDFDDSECGIDIIMQSVSLSRIAPALDE